MDSPFQYGTLATDKNFIDRVAGRAELKQMLSSGINVSLVSPRRWGKSSLVLKAMNELAAERKDIRVCYLDAFNINSEEEFYNAFASIACHSWYLQQLCFFVWYATDKEVTESILSESIQRMIDTNAPMFISDTEKLTPSQKEMLKAIVAGEEQLSSAATLSRYRLGNPNTIARNKRVLGREGLYRF